MGSSASDPNKAAMKLQEAQMERLNNLSLPELEEYILQNPELVGTLDAEQLGGSALEEISLDPKAREAQLNALQSLQQYADEGMSDADKFGMEQMLGQVSAATKSNQANIEADMARRGMDSSGAALMGKMNAQQSGANTARQQAMQQAAQGQQNRMAALNQLANQSGQMQSQDFARQAQVGSAKDAIAQANAANRYQTNAANLSARQSIENQRANTANQQAQVGNQIAQQNFNNAYARTGAQGNVANSMSSIAANADQGPSIGQTIGTIGGGIAGAYFGGPAGAAAGAQAGGAIGGSFENGGIVSNYENGGVHSNFQDGIEERKRLAKEKEEKQHDSFKSKYMKKVRDELMDEGDRRDIPSAKLHAQDGGLQRNFQDPAMPVQANPFLASGLDWNKETERVTNAANINSPVKTKGVIVPEVTSDKTSAEISTNAQANSQMKAEGVSPEGKGVDYAAALGALSKLMEDGQKEGKRELRLGQSQVQAPQNIMTPTGPTEYVNPFKGAKYEDGGVPMYASDGGGDIVDSGMESYADDRVDAKINDGEMILNVPQQQRLMDLLRGEISVDELGNDDIIEGVPRDYRDELHEEKSMEGSSKMKGIEELLRMLGEE